MVIRLPFELPAKQCQPICPPGPLGWHFLAGISEGSLVIDVFLDFCFISLLFGNLRRLACVQVLLIHFIYDLIYLIDLLFIKPLLNFKWLNALLVVRQVHAELAALEVTHCTSVVTRVVREEDSLIVT